MENNNKIILFPNDGVNDVYLKADNSPVLPKYDGNIPFFAIKSLL